MHHELESLADPAAVAKAGDLQRYPAPGAAQNWHFLTGAADAVQAVADAAGFHANIPGKEGASHRPQAEAEHGYPAKAVGHDGLLENEVA